MPLNVASYYLKCLRRFWKSAILVLTPILFSPLVIVGQSKVSSCAYVLCIMGIYWSTEACSIAVTSLLPVFLFPLFGIQSASKVSMNYIPHINFLLIGTFVLCIAIEEWNLHKRFALRVLLFFGAKPCWIMMGLMTITALLSMWLSNTSTTAMMHPIAIAMYEQIICVRKQVRESKQLDSYEGAEDTIMVAEDVNEDQDKQLRKKERGNDIKALKEEKNLKIAILLSISYAANLGGVATRIGTPTNIMAPGILSKTFPHTDKAEESLSFTNWFLFAFPITFICIIITWIWLQIRFIGLTNLWAKKKPEYERATRELIKREYESLNDMSFGEFAVLIHFFLLILLWFTRDPSFVIGWKYLFPEGYAKDSTVAVFIGTSIFLFPSKPSSFTWIWKLQPENGSDDDHLKPSPPLLTWQVFQQKFTWNIFILIGSGFALASGCTDSGLSEWMSLQLIVLKGIPTWLVVLILSTIVSLLTGMLILAPVVPNIEFLSNVTALSILLPILLRMSVSFQINPILILIPVTIACSFAFTLPIATPPNALAFRYGTVRIIDMVSAGLVLNFICVAILNLFINTTGFLIFHLDTLPEWANATITDTASINH